MALRVSIFLTFLVALSGCSRDSEDALQARLSAWFFLDGQVYFHSKMRCTAAVYSLESHTPRPSFTVYSSANMAKTAFTEKGRSAFRIAGYSPNDLTDELLLSGRGTFGKQALAAAAQAVPCFKGTKAEAQLRDALTRPGATLAYDRGSEGMMVLDPDALLLFYVAGDVW